MAQNDSKTTEMPPAEYQEALKCLPIYFLEEDSTNEWDLNFDVRWQDYLVAFIISFLFLIGFIGHAIVIRSLCSSRKQTWTQTMVKINSVFAISFLIITTPTDLKVLLSQIILKLPKTTLLSRIGCKLTMYWVLVCSGVSIFSNTMMVVDRTMGIKNPMMRARLAASRKYKTCVFIFVAVSPLITASPSLFLYESQCGVCMPLGEYQEYKRYFDLVTFIILMLVPASVSIVAIITIGIAQREKTFSQFGNGVTKKTIKHEKKFVTALYRYNVADSIFYTICLSPTRSLEIFGPYASTWVVENILTWMIYVSRVLLVSYFACTPILYSLFFDMKIRKKKATDPISSYSTSATVNSASRNSHLIEKKIPLQRSSCVF